VAKILVADDNSNIQKMVGLALKDQGIDVVAVGNGEAAVRKISDIHPDLVLADVFMPVRNGYEVCKYVKDDSSLAHIPVILLVGAFDPLDEQEAQRVGADGVLKKPFVPPDPLISMVKSALARAGVSYSSAAPDKAKEAAPAKAPDLVPATAEAAPEAVPFVESEHIPEEIPARPEPIRIDAGSQPLAFGSLLEAPEAAEEQDPGFMPAVHPELAAERDWRSSDEAEEVEEEEEEQPKASWRRDVGDEAFAAEETSGPVKDWRETAIEEPLGHKEAWEPTKEKTDFAEVDSQQEEAAAKATETPVAATTLPTQPPFSGDAWAAAVSPTVEEKPAALETAIPAAPDIVSPALPEVSATATVQYVEPSTGTQVAAATETTPVAEPEAKPAGSDWYSTPPPSPWDAEAKKASQLAATWDAVAAPKPEPAAAEPAPEPVRAPEESVSAQAAIEEAALPSATVEAIREEVTHVAEDTKHEATAPAAAAPTPSMEELVAKVLAKMSPDVLQAVTREILKPVVEALVKDELNSKKS
jgi:CheY-like chemotaxis protein